MLHSSLPKRSHKIIFSFIILVSLSLILCGCKKDEENNLPDPGNIEEINNAILLQEDAYDQLADLLQSTDTTTAKVSILSMILADPLVQLADTNSQGLYIQYKNGMRGGLIIDFEDDPQDTISPFEIETEDVLKAEQPKNIIPADERTVILNPHYFERERFTQKILSTYDKRLPLAGFYQPELHRNEDCTVEKFTFLGNYGIVHIYSHGWAWPCRSNIHTVYLMTGEFENASTSSYYWREILAGDIPIVTCGRKSHKYFLSPDFIAEYNNFTEDTTMIYGGFCYSYLGGWPEIMNNAGAAGYFGFDWSVQTRWNARWARAVIYDLTRSDLLVPMTVEYWFYNTPTRPKSYYCIKAPDFSVDLLYNGFADLALLPNKILVDLSKMTEVQSDVMSTIQWTCSSPNLTVQKITSAFGVTSRTCTEEWEYQTTFTGSIPGNIKGELYLEFNETFEKIDSFYVHNTWFFNATDEELNKYGYPTVKTQTYTGNDLPIWVNEPDLDRYIYGVQGSKAADHLSTLECKYEFPNGSSCSINKFEFTDETLQMIRFDFHIR